MDTTALTSLSATTTSGIATTTTAPPPLTTTFTPSPWCLTDLYLLSTKEPSGEDCPNGYCSWTHLGPSTSASACFPSGWGPTSYFSPGLCPSGYTEGCGRSLTTVDGSITEYRATCCPSGYGCQMRTNAPWPWYSVDLCSVINPSKIDFTITTNTSGSAPLSTVMTSASNNFDAYGISIRWQLHDFIATSTSTPSTTSSLSSISTGAETTTATPSSTSHLASSTSSLSTGAKAGIGVGVAIGGILIIFAGVFLLYIRPRQRRSENGNQGGHSHYRNKDHNAELTTTTPSTTRELHSHSLGELDSTALGELGNTPARRTAPPVELEVTRAPRVGRFEEDL